ncbi:MAG TPA: xanthine dehydrogenase family protein subunit M [Gaiellales bacterium]|jgi:carbon-monoxide dehydrogenase medium subunit|nr:xanthine dehydrogenase family protein subunit M [Gaiellales bacterium]
MIPQEFDYEHPTSVADAISLLGRHGENARLLAGGHSLVPMMKLRLAAPEALIDIGGIASLKGITDTPDSITIGALTTHAQVAGSQVIATGCPILAEAASGIGDMQVRNRGTIGGSLANADPHGDLPAVLTALQGEVTAEGPNGRRTIPAADLFIGYLQTALSPDEILTDVRVPKVARGAYVKFNRRAQDWAIVGAAVVIDGSGPRIALTGVGATPVRATAAEQAFTGSNAAEAAERASEGLDPPSDTAASGEYRVHLAKVLVRRALEAALQR